MSSTVNDINEFKEFLIEYKAKREAVLKMVGERDAMKKRLESGLLKISALEANESKYEKCIDLMQKLSGIMKTNTIKRIETLITQGLKEIAEENLKFVVQYETKRNSIQAQYKLYDEATKTHYDIINSFGGGIADIISILQRIIFIYQFDTAKILVLDEAGKWISSDKQNRFGKFLRDISHQLGIQIILITHKDNILQEADKVIRVKKIGDSSVIEETTDEAHKDTNAVKG